MYDNAISRALTMPSRVDAAVAIAANSASATIDGPSSVIESAAAAMAATTLDRNASI